MDKKQVVALVIVTNVISISLVSMIFTYRRSQQKDLAPAQRSDSQPKQTKEAPKIPQQNIKITIDSIIEQYDVIKSGRYQQAMENYKQAIRKEPPYTADSTIGYTYAKQGDYEKALKLCKEEIQTSSYPAQFYTLAWIYAKIGKYDEAIAVSKNTIGIHPRYSKIWHVLGWLYARLDENDKAVDACNNALKLDPDSAWVHYGLGRIYVILEKPEKAIESYKKAIQLQSDFAEAYLFLGVTYAELGDQEKAIESFSEAILFDRYYPEPHFFLGMAYDESGQYKKAIESFEKAITWYNSKETKIRIHGIGIRPDMATLNCIIGVCHLRLGQELEASLAFKKAIDIDDSHAGAHYGLSLAYVLLDKQDEALEEYQAVTSLKGEQFAKPLFDIIQKASSIERKSED